MHTQVHASHACTHAYTMHRERENLETVTSDCVACPQDSRVPTTPVAQIRGQSANGQRSILRQAGSSSKRRKVAFISPSIDMSGPFDSDSETSLELELEVFLTL